MELPTMVAFRWARHLGIVVIGNGFFLSVEVAEVNVVAVGDPLAPVGSDASES